jgi:hypothetical protein
MAISYGCIYFASDVVRDAVPAQITSDVSAELREQVRGKFTIGPIVDIQFWKEERAHMDISQGPCALYYHHIKKIHANSLQGQTQKTTR